MVQIKDFNYAHITKFKSSSQMLEAIAKVTDEPVKFLLHSHNHWDHGSGGAVWRFAASNSDIKVTL